MQLENIVELSVFDGRDHLIRCLIKDLQCFALTKLDTIWKGQLHPGQDVLWLVVPLHGEGEVGELIRFSGRLDHANSFSA